jgi:hypothetical protein
MHFFLSCLLSGDDIVSTKWQFPSASLTMQLRNELPVPLIVQYYLNHGGIVVLNTLNAEWNPVCHFLALLGAHPIFHVRRIRVKYHRNWPYLQYSPFCYYACFITRLMNGWRLFVNAHFRIRVLAVTQFQRILWRYKAEWRAEFFLISPYFYYATFLIASSHETASTAI